MENIKDINPMYHIVDYRSIGDTGITLQVLVDDVFSGYVNSKYHKNSGDLKIESVYQSNKEEVWIDNLNFLLNASKKEIKKELKKELKAKGLFEKGIFKLIQEMLIPFIGRGYLIVEKGNGY